MYCVLSEMGLSVIVVFSCHTHLFFRNSPLDKHFNKILLTVVTFDREVCLFSAFLQLVHQYDLPPVAQDHCCMILTF